jgi:hypothetical protein
MLTAAGFSQWFLGRDVIGLMGTWRESGFPGFAGQGTTLGLPIGSLLPIFCGVFSMVIGIQAVRVAFDRYRQRSVVIAVLGIAVIAVATIGLGIVFTDAVASMLGGGITP